MKQSWLILALALPTFARAADSYTGADGLEYLPEGQVELTDVASPEEIYSEMLEENLVDQNLLDLDATATQATNVRLYIHVSKFFNRDIPQTLRVYQDGALIPGWEWPVSTAKEGRYCDATSGARCGYAHTPTGRRYPGALDWTHYSRRFGNAPMHRAIQWGSTGGIFLHATYGNHIKQLGRPASHGCIRQRPDNAERLWMLVKRTIETYGRTAVVIDITEN